MSTAAPENTAAPTTAPTTTTAAPQGAPQAATTTAERPSWLPEKFASPEALAASYKELESRLSAPKPEAQTPAPTAPVSADQLASDLSNANVDINTFYAEYAKNGKLSEESYGTLEKAGRPRAEIDAFIAGQEALMEQQSQTIYSDVGGRPQYEAMQAWAKVNMSRGELEAFNAAADRGNFNAIRLAVKGMHARYVEATGSEPSLMGGRPGIHASGYQSPAEVTAAMADPRYKNDPAYRAAVVAKLAVGSPFQRRR